MKREAKNPESERECGCKSGSGSIGGGESCCQTNNASHETSQFQEHRHEHGSEHKCDGHSCDCR